MLFTERNYRSLALLCRLLAEQNGLPRNFPLLPYLDNARDATNAALFRKLILSDQRRDLIARKLGTTTAIIEANEAAFTSFYNANSARRIWTRFFGWDPDPDGNPNTNDARVDLPCFRGFSRTTSTEAIPARARCSIGIASRAKYGIGGGTRLTLYWRWLSCRPGAAPPPRLVPTCRRAGIPS